MAISSKQFLGVGVILFALFSLGLIGGSSGLLSDIHPTNLLHGISPTEPVYRVTCDSVFDNTGIVSASCDIVSVGTGCGADVTAQSWFPIIDRDVFVEVLVWDSDSESQVVKAASSKVDTVIGVNKAVGLDFCVEQSIKSGALRLRDYDTKATIDVVPVAWGG